MLPTTYNILINMIGRQDLKNISKTRLKEAKTLYKNGLYDGAKYLLGYSLETAFKAIICRILDTNYPERGDITRVYHTHKFDVLVVLSGLEKKIDEKISKLLKTIF
jgi:HEPN domain-containing protein